MRLSAVLICSAPLWGLSNAVTLQEKSGATQTNRVVTIPRFLADKEVCQNPRPYVAGSAVSYWQADVKSRWPGDSACTGGYAKFALITVELTMTGGSMTSVEFRSDVSASSAGSGLTKAAMLAFDAGGGASSWGAKITAGVAALSASASARTMIGNNQYRILESGPLRTSVLVREGPDAVSAATTRSTSFGFQCTANCVAPYNTATWADNSAYYSMRPSFVVTFYSPHSGAGSVEIDYLLDNAWMDRAQDQRLESFVLYNGGSETTACYTAPAAFVVPFRSRVFETCWSSNPGAINIDFNRAYVTYSKVTPAYGLNYTVGASAAALEVADFNSTDQGATVTVGEAPEMGTGQIRDKGGATGGSSPTIGWASRWAARYMASGFDYTLLPVILGNAKAQMHAPYWYLENSPTAVYYSGGAAKAFGSQVSIDARPMFSSSTWGTAAYAGSPTSPHGDTVSASCAAPNCMVTCVNRSSATANWCSTFAANTVNNWGFDIAHSHNEFFLAYLITGKRVYLEGLWEMATVALAWGPPENPPVYNYGRWGNRGITIDSANNPRGTAWALRNIGMATVLSDDGSVEKAYLSEKLNNNLEAHEGRYNIINGSFPPANSSCSGFDKTTETSIWRMYRCWGESGWSNPLNISLRHQGSSICYGCDLTLAGDGQGPWTDQYWITVLAWIRGLGYNSAIHEVEAKNDIHTLADSARTGGNPAFALMYVEPGETSGNLGYLQTWAAIRAAIITTGKLSLDIGASDTSISLATVCDTKGNSLDLNFKNYTYWTVDSEKILLSTTSWPYKLVASTDAMSDRLTTSSAHGYVTGQIVRLIANTALDPGVTGNPLCRQSVAGGPRDDNCDFWVKVIDSTTVELYNDSALTSKVDLQGGGAMYLSTCTVNVTRGVLGTMAGAHSKGANIAYYPVIAAPIEASDPSGGHGYYFVSGLSTAVDFDVSDTAEDSGARITGKRAFDLIDQTIYNQQLVGSNVANCAGAGLNLITCDNPQWSIRPRPLVKNVRVVPGTTSVKVYYTAPDGNACRVGVSASGFPSTDDSGDTPDAQTNAARAYTIAGLTGGTTYSYRITCGAGRVNGSFRTN